MRSGKWNQRRDKATVSVLSGQGKRGAGRRVSQMCWQKDLAVSCPPCRAVASTGSEQPQLFLASQGQRIHRFPPQTPREVSLQSPAQSLALHFCSCPSGIFPPQPQPGEHPLGHQCQPQTLWQPWLDPPQHQNIPKLVPDHPGQPPQQPPCCSKPRLAACPPLPVLADALWHLQVNAFQPP